MLYLPAWSASAATCCASPAPALRHCWRRAAGGSDWRGRRGPAGRLGLRRATGFDPFRSGEVDYGSAGPIAALLAAAFFMLQPVVVQLIRVFWFGKTGAPEQVNYTQAWAQAVVVIPLMGAACLMAAVLWGEARGEAGPAGPRRLDHLRRGRRSWLALLAVPAVGRLRVAVAAVVLLGPRPPALARCGRRDGGAAGRRRRVPPAAERGDDAAARLDRRSVGRPARLRLGAAAGGDGLLPGDRRAGRHRRPPVHRRRARMVEPPGRLARHLCRRVDGRVGGGRLRPAAGGLAGDDPPDGGAVGRRRLDRHGAGRAVRRRSDATGGTEAKSPSQKALEVLAAIAPFVFIGGVLVGVASVLDALIAGFGGSSWSRRRRRRRHQRRRAGDHRRGAASRPWC